MSLLKQYNRQFGIDREVLFTNGRGGAPVVEVVNDSCRAVIALQGAQVLEFQPHSEEPLIFISSLARFASGKSLRGGVPICWPWFGPHASDPTQAAHGFARNRDWVPVQVLGLPDGSTRIDFTFDAKSDCGLTAHYTVVAGEQLHLSLTTVNHGDSPYLLSQALHTYFVVSDIRNTIVTGLEGVEYLDKVAAGLRQLQQGDIRFSGEVDRIYLDAPKECTIFDGALRRKIVIESSGSAATVVWNPWEEKGAKFGDLGPDGYLKMLCVETANAASDSILLQPGQSHTLQANYRSELWFG